MKFHHCWSPLEKVLPMHMSDTAMLYRLTSFIKWLFKLI